MTLLAYNFRGTKIHDDRIPHKIINPNKLLLKYILHIT